MKTKTYDEIKKEVEKSTNEDNSHQRNTRLEECEESSCKKNSSDEIDYLERKTKYVELLDGFEAEIIWSYNKKTKEVLSEEIIVFYPNKEEGKE